MREEIIIAGFGGQGILFAGKLLCESGMKFGLNVTYLPSYGAEVRGGTAHCHVILSGDCIPSPVVGAPDILLAMNEPSFIKFEPKIKTAGFLLVNSTLVNSNLSRSDITIVDIPAAEIADKIGNIKAGNMVMLGGLLRHRSILPKENILENLKNIFKADRKNLLDINVKAFNAGYDYECSPRKVCA